MDNDGPRTVKSVETASRLLDALLELNGAGITELAEMTDTSKAGVSHHVTTLKRENFVKKRGGKYELSYRFLNIGERVRLRDPLFLASLDKMGELASDTQMNVHLMVEEYGMGVNIHKEQGSEGFGERYHQQKIGKPLPLHWNAPGKAILSEMPDERISEIVDENGLPTKTDQTIQLKEELWAEIDDIRDKGYALNDEEEVPGTRAVGSSIVGDDGMVLGAISISAAKHQMPDEKFNEEYPEIITEASNMIELSLATEEY